MERGPKYLFLSIFPSGFGDRVDTQTFMVLGHVTMKMIQRGLGFSKKLKLGFKALRVLLEKKDLLDY
jgi:hypothetical protein